MALSPQTAKKMADTGWTLARFAFALFFFTWLPFTALVILVHALGQLIFGDPQTKNKTKQLGLNPFNWMQEYKYLWFFFGAELAVMLAFAFGAYMPAIASFYIALWPTMVMMNYIGLCALGLALLIGLAYLILKPADPPQVQYIMVPVYQGREVSAHQFQQGQQPVQVAQPVAAVGYWERLGTGYVLGGTGAAVPVAVVDGQR